MPNWIIVNRELKHSPVHFTTRQTSPSLGSLFPRRRTRMILSPSQRMSKSLPRGDKWNESSREHSAFAARYSLFNKLINLVQKWIHLIRFCFNLNFKSNRRFFLFNGQTEWKDKIKRETMLPIKLCVTMFWQACFVSTCRKITITADRDLFINHGLAGMVMSTSVRVLFKYIESMEMAQRRTHRTHFAFRSIASPFTLLFFRHYCRLGLFVCLSL